MKLFMKVPFILFISLLSVQLMVAQESVYFSKGDLVKGFHWDGTNANYVANIEGKLTLYTRRFNGLDLDPKVNSASFSIGDFPKDAILRGFNVHLDNSRRPIYSYVVFDPVDNSSWLVQRYAGRTNEIARTRIESRDPIRGWWWDGSKIAAYLYYTGGATQIIVREFDGSSFGEVIKEFALAGGDKNRTFNYYDKWELGTISINYCELRGGKLYLAQRKLN
ncbi:MAG: hypothetical protein AAF798_10570 [Bacteroidota bacterium]